ncbi:MAG: phosphoenolpyruvate--protein phosphotransferase [Chloracidobacterium sp.]|nr:phosphoenolpyruvate--protein phosphotransferase [Chloracidobacterium sp.]
MNREQRIPALAVSRGIGIGQIVFLRGENIRSVRFDLNSEETEAELLRFKAALDKSILRLHEIASNDDPNEPVSGIFGVHLLILESSFAEKIQTFIHEERVNAEWAIRMISDHYIKQQESVSDISFRDKYLDIKDVANHLLKELNGSHAADPTVSGSVIVARDLSPSTIIEIAKKKPVAIITELGGWTSHSSILAREFDLPMVSGVRNLEQFVSAGDCVIVDGVNGEIILNPSDKTVAEFEALGKPDKHSGIHISHNNEAAKTNDATHFLIRANIDKPESYETAKNMGAQGIGLYRSESLLRQSGPIPTEDQQFEAYCQIADAVGEHGVKIRTFDVGVERFGSDAHWVERNPSLGLRAIRLSLADPTHFRIQIRSLLRAAFGRNIDIVLPMISGVGEITRSKAIIEEERFDLIKSGIDIGKPKLGAMIETPSAVLTAFDIATQVDFLCLGTNDLVQYLLAVDRDNDAVADWYQTLHPAVIRAIASVFDAAQKADIPVSVCGEMAGSPFYVPVLLGLGAREFSMNTTSIPQVLQLLTGISLPDSIALVTNIQSLLTAEEIEGCLREYYLKNWSALFPLDFLNSRFR